MIDVEVVFGMVGILAGACSGRLSRSWPYISYISAGVSALSWIICFCYPTYAFIVHLPIWIQVPLSTFSLMIALLATFITIDIFSNEGGTFR